MNDRELYGEPWCCPLHGRRAAVRTSSRSGRTYFGCPVCKAFARGYVGDVDWAMEPQVPPDAPVWRQRNAERPPMADWWTRRHHCSDVVLGQRPAPEDDLPF